MRSSLKPVFPDLPERFLATRLDELTEGYFRWRTIKNLRCKKRIPESCFVKLSPRKIIILRDEFLEWAATYAYCEA